jgi:hypothetical protein
MGSVRQNLGDVGANGFLVGRILRRGIGVLLPLDDGVGQQLARGGAENALFPAVEGLQMPGDLNTYSTKRWSQKGTRTSNPTAMLMRSLRSSRNWTKRVRCR